MLNSPSLTYFQNFKQRVSDSDCVGVCDIMCVCFAGFYQRNKWFTLVFQPQHFPTLWRYCMCWHTLYVSRCREPFEVVVLMDGIIILRLLYSLRGFAPEWIQPATVITLGEMCPEKLFELLLSCCLIKKQNEFFFQTSRLSMCMFTTCSGLARLWNLNHSSFFFFFPFFASTPALFCWPLLNPQQLMWRGFSKSTFVDIPPSFSVCIPCLHSQGRCSRIFSFFFSPMCLTSTSFFKYFLNLFIWLGQSNEHFMRCECERAGL